MIQEGINIINFLYSWKFWITVIIVFLIIAWIWSNVVSFFTREPKKKYKRRKKANEGVDYDSEDFSSEDEFSSDEESDYEEIRPRRMKPRRTFTRARAKTQINKPPPGVTDTGKSYKSETTDSDHNIENDVETPRYKHNEENEVGIIAPYIPDSNFSAIKTRTIDTYEGLFPTRDDIRNKNIYHRKKVDLTPKVPTDIPDFESHLKEKWKHEAECRRILQTIYGVSFPKSYPDWLVNDKTGKKMELDGFNEKLMIAFEYMGEQHYKSDHFFNKSYEHFEKQNYRDKLKFDLCVENGVYLIIIPYNIPFRKLEGYIRSNIHECVTERDRRKRQIEGKYHEN